MNDINENEFYREASLRICGTLDIGKAMSDCVLYVKNFIPISEMVLSQYEKGTGLIRNLVTVDSSGRTRIVPPIPLANDIIPIVKDTISDWQEVKIEDNPEQHPIVKILIPHNETPNPSLMYMIMVMEGTLLGVVGILAEGKGVYKEIHAHLFSLLREPFSIAASNALRYEEVLRLKNMVDAENKELNRELLGLSGNEIVGAEFGLARVMEMVRQVAPLNSPVMILGETGVGKEVIANAIHRMSPRSHEPFIKVNCGAIPEGLLDAELFGHEKGAFTGAIIQKRGRFERAHKGSIFLDEIAELPIQAQVKLLRVIQHKEIERVGGIQMIPVDVRIIS
ncbi:sigma-54 factor interaction domain-containing protein, partial [archaeon]|nr:sigma-54 factor interaction domain-containing protein [archaeon]